MASSFRKAQSPLSCQLCDNPNIIKWKCMDCVFLICDNCKERIHPRFELSEIHTEISTTNVIYAQFGPVISSLLITYTSELPAFTKIQYFRNDTIYCSFHAGIGYKFVIIRLLKESMKVVQKLYIECADFALDKIHDEVYYGQFRGSDVKVLSNNGVPKTVLSTAPMLIMCIHINKCNEIILGIREQGSPFPVTEFSTRQIAVFGEDNKRDLTIQHGQMGEKLFTYVWRISSDLYNNIYAIDQFENFAGRLIGLNRYHGALKFIYVGHRCVNSSLAPFNPMDIVVTETNIIIVCDKNNHSLHALNTKGELIGLQTLTDIGVTYPTSLCIDNEGYLLVGCKTSISKCPNAKLHVAKLAL